MTRNIECGRCNQRIEGDYITALGICWHPTHFTCEFCHRPIGDAKFYEHTGKPYHEACYLEQIVEKCAYCKRPLVESYSIDGWGTKFCNNHLDVFPACSFCGRLIPSPHHTNIDDHVVCQSCRSRSINTILQAQPRFYQLVQWITSQSLWFDGLELQIELCSWQQMNERSGSNLKQCLGLTTIQINSTYKDQQPQAQVKDVTILRGLPVPLFESVTIHEIGHTWLVVHGITDLPSWATEGFCELLSHRFLTMVNDPHAGVKHSAPRSGAAHICAPR